MSHLCSSLSEVHTRVPPNKPSEDKESRDFGISGNIFAARDNKGERFFRRPSRYFTSLQGVLVCQHFPTLDLDGDRIAAEGHVKMLVDDVNSG